MAPVAVPMPSEDNEKKEEHIYSEKRVLRIQRNWCCHII